MDIDTPGGYFTSLRPSNPARLRSGHLLKLFK